MEKKMEAERILEDLQRASRVVNQAFADITKAATKLATEQHQNNPEEPSHPPGSEPMPAPPTPPESPLPEPPYEEEEEEQQQQRPAKRRKPGGGGSAYATAADFIGWGVPRGLVRLAQATAGWQAIQISQLLVRPPGDTAIPQGEWTDYMTEKFVGPYMQAAAEVKSIGGPRCKRWGLQALADSRGDDVMEFVNQVAKLIAARMMGVNVVSTRVWAQKQTMESLGVMVQSAHAFLNGF